MVLEIAIGVMLGIVLGTIVLRYWRQVIASSVLLAIVLAVLVASVVAGIYLWEQRTTVLAGAGAFALIGVLYGVPFFFYGKVVQTYPQFGALLKGEAPWNNISRFPARFLVMLVFSFAVAGLGIGGLLGSVWLVEHAAKFIIS